MKNGIAALLVVCLAVIACKKDPLDGTPSCIQTKIKDFKTTVQKSGCPQEGIVKAYLFQNDTVYTFDWAWSCIADQATPILNADCDTLGYLGGFAGNTSINGIPFSNAVFLKTIWER